jgi:hypothetical protein
MRVLVVVLALMAAGKLCCQEYLFRAAARDAILDAYREHAVQACQKSTRNVTLGVNPLAWANPQSVDLVIGKRSYAVYPWQVDHANWSARYRNPYLFLTVGSRPAKTVCAYDIHNASASLTRM